MADFTKAEIDFLGNAQLIEEKNRLQLQLIEMLAKFGEELQSEFNESFRLSPPAKVNRGEHYKGLPYLVMDYPRIFSKANVFAFRSLFWWGNFISCTLHLKGEFQTDFKTEVFGILERLKGSESHPAFVSFRGNEWNHNLQTEDYQKVKHFDAESLENYSELPFIKIACLLPIEKLSEMEDFFEFSKQTLLEPLR